MTAKMMMSLVALMLVMGALIFASAGTLDYWQAWLFLGCYFTASVFLSAWMARNDPSLLERRMRGGPFAEAEPTQKIIMTVTSAAFIAALVVPGLDHRFGWSRMAPAVAILGDAVHLAGWYGIYRVFRANSYAAATIQVASGQTVISTGPYAIVRHPMYAATIFQTLAVPVALGSWWGVVGWLLVLPALVWRLLDEERVLRRDLDGYSEYQQKVRWRLLPRVW